MIRFQKLYSGSANRGFNFAYEAIIVALLLAVIIIGLIKFDYANDNSYVITNTKVNDFFVILSTQNDDSKTREIAEFIFENETYNLIENGIILEKKIDDYKRYSYCIERKTNYLSESDLGIKNNFVEIRVCT